MTVFMLVGDMLILVGKRVCVGRKESVPSFPTPHTLFPNQHQQAPTSYHILLYTLSFGLGDTGRCWLVWDGV